ncbi:MAG: hypothetical protein ABEH78_01195 [Haloferacaceae archaeon]
MGGQVDRERAIEIARDYADGECVGELGEVLDAAKENDLWIVEFRTHTFSDSYDHRLKITVSVGNVVSHERKDRLD